MSPLVSGFAELAAAVEAVEPLVSGTTALGPSPAPPLAFFCLRSSTARGSGSTAYPSGAEWGCVRVDSTLALPMRTPS